MANGQNSQFENPTSYEIPYELKVTDFRNDHGGPDPYFEQALIIVDYYQAGNADLNVVRSVQRELLRARAAFADIQSHEDPKKDVVSQPYKTVANFFGERIDRILAGEELEQQ
jgi:hypothetical protein